MKKTFFLLSFSLLLSSCGQTIQQTTVIPVSETPQVEIQQQSGVNTISSQTGSENSVSETSTGSETEKGSILKDISESGSTLIENTGVEVVKVEQKETEQEKYQKLINSIVSKQNPEKSDCTTLTQEKELKSCEQQVLLRQSVTKKNISLCNLLDSNLKSYCSNNYHLQVAVESKDIKVCDQIKTTKVSTGSGNTTTVANNVTPQLKDSCILNYVITQATKDVKNCDGMSNIQMKKQCVSLSSSK